MVSESLPTIAELVAAGALFVVNHSGGKDSQLLYRTVKTQVPAEQIVVIHADLGRVEWPGLKEHIRATTDDVPMYVSRNLNKDLLSMADERGMFPSPKYRQCTSDLKRAPIERQIRQLTPAKADDTKHLVVDCIGQRAQESKDRAKLKPFERHGKNCNGVRDWYTWRPVHDATLEDVWASEGHTADELEQRRALWRAGRKAEAVAGWRFHWAYVAGMSRLSCSFCIMSTKADIQVAGRERPELLAEYDAIERKHDVTMMMPTKDGKRLFLTDIVALADDEIKAAGCASCAGGCSSEAAPQDEPHGAADLTPNSQMSLTKHLNQVRKQLATSDRILPLLHAYPQAFESVNMKAGSVTAKLARQTLILPLKQRPADYFAAPVISNSYLSSGGVPLDVKPETLRFGSLLHMSIYEPAEYQSTPEFKQFTATRTVRVGGPAVTENDKICLKVAVMNNAAQSCAILRYFLDSKNTVFEQEVFALLSGVVPVKVKLDAKNGRSGQDLKTTACRSRADFLSKFEDYGYWRQAVLYKEVCGLKNFYFTGISKHAPHPVFTVDTSQYKAEMKQARKELEDLVLAHLQNKPAYITEALAYLAPFLK